MAIPVASLPKGNRGSLCEIIHSEKVTSSSPTVKDLPITYKHTKHSDWG